MITRLPYRATTTSGENFDIEFPLHRETASPVRVSQLLTLVLKALDHDVELDRTASNGDVLQAMAMAIAVRAAMVPAPKAVTDQLVKDLVQTALKAMDDAKRDYTVIGHA